MNKKIVKSIVSITCGLGIAASIPFMVSNCACSQEKIKPLPEEVYDIDENNTLLGFKDEFLNDPTSPIYKNNFKKCNAMQIPASVTSVNQEVFYKNWISTIPSFIKKLTFTEESLCTSIGEKGFEYCASLTSIDLSNTNLSTISSDTFSYCSSLTLANLPSSLEFIGGNAFYKCKELKSIDLSSCTNLSIINVYTFAECSSLTSASFPCSLETIGDYAFQDCSKLTSVDFSKATNLSSIHECAFENCSLLTSVSFHSSLNTIGHEVFRNCSKLISITWNAWTGSFNALGNDAFSGVCQTKGTVRVTNPDDGHDSAALLAHLIQNGGLPDTWQVAKD